MAISRNCVATTRHQGGTSGEVVIGGKSYSIDQIWNHSADLRVVKLENDNLRHFVNLYTNTDESGQEMRIGGFGKGRGAILQTGGKTYGYTWSGASNTIQRWCTNKINSSDSIGGSYPSQVLTADFDGIGEGDSTTYEGTIASWDSGEGWFIYQGGEWKVAALSRGVEIHFVEGHEGDPAYYLYEAWFRDRANPNIKAPDYLDGVRISSYASWINSVIPEVLPGDLTGDDWVDLSDLSVFAGFWSETNCQAPDFCLGADSEPDGDVDWDDLVVLLGNWLSSF